MSTPRNYSLDDVRFPEDPIDSILRIAKELEAIIRANKGALQVLQFDESRKNPMLKQIEKCLCNALRMLTHDSGELSSILRAQTVRRNHLFSCIHK
jgi:hypothetical protein